MASMYSAKVMEHFANPHNVGEIPDANGVGEVGNPKCGDIMRMYLKIENNVIVDVKFLTFGCGAAIATSSMATDLIKGKTIDDALKLTNKAVVEALEGLPPIKVHCSVLAEQAVDLGLDVLLRRLDVRLFQRDGRIVLRQGDVVQRLDAGPIAVLIQTVAVGKVLVIVIGCAAVDRDGLTAGSGRRRAGLRAARRRQRQRTGAKKAECLRHKSFQLVPSCGPK